MLDKHLLPLIQPTHAAVARQLVRMGVGANQVSCAGLAIGLFGALAIAMQYYTWGAVLIIVSRICDGLDGAVARATKTTDFGGFLDISLDFVFYAAIPLAFAVANPADHALPMACLLACFVATGCSFLAYAVVAEKRGMVSYDYPKAVFHKSFYFISGLAEATETLACFIAMCLWPQYAAAIAYGFCAVCVLTVVLRVYGAYRSFK